MTYEDALQESLEALRAGRSLDAVLAHPEHAARLRDDLSLATEVRVLARDLPTMKDAASRFEAQLTAARDARRVTPQPRRGFWPAWTQLPVWSRALGLAASAAVVALIAVIVLGLPGGGSNAVEASTLEGVVLENANGRLTLQTDRGVETVSLEPGAALTDASGAGVDVANIEAGQLLQVQGKRAAQGQFVAKVLNLRTPEALQSWCVDHISRCQEATGALQQRLEQCQQVDTPQCQVLRTRLQQLRNNLPNLARLADLRNRCQKGGRAACVELLSICNAHPDQCAAIQDWLRTYRGSQQ